MSPNILIETQPETKPRRHRQEAVTDYYTLRQLALKVGISEAQIAELELKALLRPKMKNGKRFFSSSQAHALKVALRLGRNQGVSLDQAFARVEEVRLRQASTIRN